MCSQSGRSSVVIDQRQKTNLFAIRARVGGAYSQAQLSESRWIGRTRRGARRIERESSQAGGNPGAESS
jgi:hypothetical protein